MFFNNKLLLPSALVLLAAFLPLFLFFLSAIRVIPEFLPGNQQVALYILLGVLLSLAGVVTTLHRLNAQGVVNVPVVRTIGLTIGLLLFIFLVTVITREVLKLGKASSIVGVIAFAVAGYFIRENLKGYSFEHKELYWTLLGGLIVFLLYGLFFGFTVFFFFT